MQRWKLWTARLLAVWAMALAVGTGYAWACTNGQVDDGCDIWCESRGSSCDSVDYDDDSVTCADGGTAFVFCV